MQNQNKQDNKTQPRDQRVTTQGQQPTSQQGRGGKQRDPRAATTQPDPKEIDSDLDDDSESDDDNGDTSADPQRNGSASGRRTQQGK